MEFAIAVGLGAILCLALFDLWVGVANDAVNFLNSAIGSRAAARRTIFAVAGAGVLVGALTSQGMMEVARKGIFDPSNFYAADGTLMIQAILAIYLGVMAADVLLLDLFNTFGLPTSTTVSIVSELAGASIAVALWLTPGGFLKALQVIQSDSLLAIYTGIFMSVLIAFSVSALLMMLVRSIYGHDLSKSFPKLGWIWIGICFAAMSYFVIYKGLKGAGVLTAPEKGGAGLLSAAQIDLFYASLHWIVLGVFALAAAIGVAMGQRYKAVLRFIILIGTGALGLAFAGNDLVNFIGPSVAAFQAVLHPDINLAGKVSTPQWALLIAGVVMVASLYRSKKARRVTDTEVRLAAHGATSQRFKTNALARGMVAWSVGTFNLMRLLVPGIIRRRLDARTAPPLASAELPPYDILRATVNITVAAVLISIGTAQKLPLSTTYITFTAAMGAALGDRTWSRHDAEARVTGILTVMGGWLITGFLAAAGAFVMASIIALGNSWGIFAALALVLVGTWLLRRVKGSEDSMGGGSEWKEREEEDTSRAA